MKGKEIKKRERRRKNIENEADRTCLAATPLDLYS
jgi:hypothetical protein